MHWWEEAEARAHRSKTAMSLAEAVLQRLLTAGVDRDLAYAPAYDLAVLYALCADYVKLIEAMLLTADGDLAGCKRGAQLLSRWLGRAALWADSSGPAFNQLLDSLDLDPERLAGREEALEGSVPTAGRPDEEAKLAGRFRQYHLLYERLDLKFSSVDLPDDVRRGLARGLSRLYEQALLSIRMVSGLERDAHPRFGAVARLLLDLNTTWHFDLAPSLLRPGEIRLRGPGGPGLPTWLLLAFGR